MIRLIVELTDIGAAANVGGPVQVRYKTFDVDLPDVEEVLRAANETRWEYGQIKGWEIISGEEATGNQGGSEA